MTERVDHAELANEAISIEGMRAAFDAGESLAEIAAVAQVHATLALAEQQRIANLIALTVSTDAGSLARQTSDELGHEVTGLLADDSVRAALGL